MIDLPTRTTSETEFQRIVVEYARAHGWTVRVMDQRNARGVLRAQSKDQRGWPDLLMLRADRPLRSSVAALWVELKAHGKPTSDLQDVRIAQLRATGHTVLVAGPDDWPTLQSIIDA